MKKILSLFLVCSMITATIFCTAPIAYADAYDNPYNPIITHTEAPVTIDSIAENIIPNALAEKTSAAPDRYFIGDTITYTFTISEAGTYAMWNYMPIVGSGLSFDIELDGAPLSAEENKIADNTIKHNYGRIGNIDLTEGPHTVKYTIIGNTADNSNYYNMSSVCLKIKKVSDIPVSSTDTTLLRHADYFKSNMSEAEYGTNTWESEFSKNTEIITPDFGTVTRPTYTGQWSTAGYFTYSLDVATAGMYYATYYTSDVTGTPAWGERSYEIGVSDVLTTIPDGYMVKMGDAMATTANPTEGTELYPEDNSSNTYTQLYKSAPTPVYLAEGTNYLKLKVRGNIGMGGFLTLEKCPENPIIFSKGTTYVPSRMAASSSCTATADGTQYYRFATNTDSVPLTSPAQANNADGTSVKYSKFPIFYNEDGTITYNVEAEADVLYNLKVDAAVDDEGGGTVALTVNGDSLGYKNLSLNNTAASPVFENVPLKKGLNTLVFNCTAPNCYGTMNHLVFTKIKDIEHKINKIEANAVEFTADATIARGTDIFTLTFSNDLNQTAFNENDFVLKKGEEAVPTVAQMDESNPEIVYLMPKTSLDYDADYSININGAKATYGLTIENYQLDFSTVATSAGDTGYAVLDGTGVPSQRNFDINGTLKNAKGIGIKGRTLTITGKDRNNNALTPALNEVLATGDDGIFTFDYTLPDAYTELSGTYTFTATDEYGAYANIPVNYISPEDEGRIVSALKGTSTAGEVEEFFTTPDGDGMTNADKLGLNISTDLTGLNSTDFYAHFVGATVSTGDALRTLYEENLTLEKFNQAADGTVVESLLDDERNKAILKLDENKRALIVNNANTLNTAIADLPPQGSAALLVEEINSLINEKLLVEYNKADSTSVAASNTSVYTNQGYEINLALDSLSDGIKKITYNLTSSTEDIFDSVAVTTSLSGVTAEAKAPAAQVKASGDALEVTLTFPSPADGVDASKLGSLSLSAPSSAGTYSIAINGELLYDEGIPYDLVTTIKPASINLSTRTNTNKGSTGYSGISSGNISSKPKEPAVTSPESNSDISAINCNFKDMTGVEWSVEAVNELFHRGIISDNEEKLFRPNDYVTREEFVKMIIEALGLTDNIYNTDINDVPKDRWSYPYIAAAMEKGIVVGDDKGGFRPGENISRQDMAVIIIRVMDKLYQPYTTDGELFADDSQIAEYAKKAVYAAKNIGIINGVGNNMCAPKGNATRAMAAKVIYEMIKAVGL